MVNWLTVPDSTKKNAYEQISEATGMSLEKRLQYNDRANDL